MAEKDIAEKTLMEYEDVFADILNVLLFKGKCCVKPEDLKSTGIRNQYKADNDCLCEMERDVAKIWQKTNIRIAMFGLENQTKVEKDMPFRIIGYDGGSYRSQLQRNEKERYPVISIVLYFGKSHWKKPRSLGEVVSVPGGLKEYFNDYRINVFEISWLSDEQVNMFKSDFKVVADYFVQIRKNNSYKPNPKELAHVDEVLKLLSVFGEEQRFCEKYKENKIGNERKVKNMCEWLDRVEEDCRAQGRAEGRKSAIGKLLEKEMSEEFILSLGYTEEEILEVKQELTSL